jgi:hypothetical protein
LVENAFIGKKDKPTDTELSAALGSVKAVWDQLITDLATELKVDIQEWKSYSVKAGWALRLLQKKRTIVWMAPCKDCFRVAFILGDKAVKAARQAKLPKKILDLLDEAPRYPEGTGLRIEVKNARELAAIKKLAVIKIAN